MNYQDKLERLIDGKDGLIFTKEVEEAGIPRQYLNILVKENKLERVAHGVYLTPDTFDDEMYRLQAKNQRAIFSHRDPIEWSATVPYGYNATHLRNEGVTVCTVKKPLHQMGVTELRTICDIIRNRNNRSEEHTYELQSKILISHMPSTA